jgi:hypothetical protein
MESLLAPEQEPSKWMWDLDFTNPAFIRGCLKMLKDQPKEWYPKHRETLVKVFVDLEKQLMGR